MVSLALKGLLPGTDVDVAEDDGRTCIRALIIADLSKYNPSVR